MKKVLLGHSIIEMLAGLGLIVRPDLLLMTENQNIQTIVVAKLYGILAITFGLVCFMVYKVFLFNNFFKKIILAIMLFHMMVAFHMYSAYNQGVVSNLGPFGLHIVLAFLFFGAYLKDLNSFDQNINS